MRSAAKPLFDDEQPHRWRIKLNQARVGREANFRAPSRCRASVFARPPSATDDARGNRWIGDLAMGLRAHSSAAGPVTAQAFVPRAASKPGGQWWLGCIAVFDAR
jgi:hypothetical protein